MSNSVSQAEFARLCDCSRQAVGQAVDYDRVHLDASGKVPIDDEANLIFRDEQIERLIGEMVETGELLPGWSALSAIIDGGKVTFALFPPHKLFDEEVFTLEGAAMFNLDTLEIEADPVTVKATDGKLYRVEIVMHPTARPPWLMAAEREAAGVKA